MFSWLSILSVVKNGASVIQCTETTLIHINFDEKSGYKVSDTPSGLVSNIKTLKPGVKWFKSPAVPDSVQ